MLKKKKNKRTAKVVGLETQRCQDIKGIEAPEKGPRSFGAMEKQALGPNDNRFSQLRYTLTCRFGNTQEAKLPVRKSI